MKTLGYVIAVAAAVCSIYSLWIEWYFSASVWLLAAVAAVLITKFAVTRLRRDFVALVCVGTPKASAGYRVYLEDATFHFPGFERLFLVPRRNYVLELGFTGNNQIESLDGEKLDVQAVIQVPSVRPAAVPTLVSAMEGSGFETGDLEAFLLNLASELIRFKLHRVICLDGKHWYANEQLIEATRAGLASKFADCGLKILHAEIVVLPAEIEV